MVRPFRRTPNSGGPSEHPRTDGLPQVRRGGVLRSGYDGAMASFTLDGETYEYRRQDPRHPPEDTSSWEYGNYPKVMARVPLAGGATVDVYAHASRWNPSEIAVSWTDDADHKHWAWIPTGSVHRVTDSEWDIEEYRRCPEKLRAIRWNSRLPGFLPA